MVLADLFGATIVRITIACTIVNVYLRNTFVSASPIRGANGPDTHVSVVFLFRVDVSRIVRDRAMFLSILTNNGFRVRTMVIAHLQGAIRAVVKFPPPRVDIHLYHLVMLPRDGQLIRRLRDLLRANVHGYLYTRPRRGLLLNLRGAYTQVFGLYCEFWDDFVATNVRVRFCRVVVSALHVE